jgi:adenylate cyclase
VATEIERKFLVATRPADLERHPSDRIEQGYVAVDAAAEVRIRRRGDAMTLTVKSKPGRTRTEEEFAIDERRFESLWELTAGRRVIKTRYVIDHDGVQVELDEYHDALAGLMTAEVEFASEAESDAFQAPAWLGQEITGDPRYANQSLAMRGRP